MIRQIKTRLAVYDPSHLYGNGTFWALHDQQDSVASLETLRAQYMATGVAGDAFEDGSIIAGVVASENLVGIVRVLDGGRDERGRAGRRVLCFLVANRSELAGLDLSYFIRSKLLVQIADRVRTGGRIVFPAGFEISSSVNTKPAAEISSLRVDSHGEFNSRPDVALAYISHLLKDAKKWAHLATGFILDSSSCRGKLNVTQRQSDRDSVASIEDDWAEMTAASLFSKKANSQKSGSPGLSVHSVADDDSSAIPHVPRPLLSDSRGVNHDGSIPKLFGLTNTFILWLGGAAVLLAGILCGGILGQGFRASDIPDCSVELNTSTSKVTAGESVKVTMSLTSPSHSKIRRVFVAMIVPGVESGSAIATLDGRNIDVYRHGDRFLFELLWPAKAETQKIVFNGRIDPRFKGDEVTCIAKCISPIVKIESIVTAKPLKISVLRHSDLAIQVIPSGDSKFSLPRSLSPNSNVQSVKSEYQWTGKWQEACDLQVDVKNLGPSALNTCHLEFKASNTLEISNFIPNGGNIGSSQIHRGKPIQLGNLDVNQSVSVSMRVISKMPFRENASVTLSVVDSSKRLIAEKNITIIDKRERKPTDSDSPMKESLSEKPATDKQVPSED